MSDDSPVAVIYDGNGNAATIFPAGFIRTSDEPRQIFYDPFDTSLDTAARWISPTSSGGGVSASILTGTMTLASGTTASGYSHLQSQPNFVPSVPAWLGYSFAIKIEYPVTTNATRGWGAGTSPGVPTTSIPLTDGIAFEIDTTGKLGAVVYASGVRTLIQDLSSSGNNTQPIDNNYHRYIIYVRTDKIYWYIDGLSTPVASSNFQAPNIQTLPMKLYAVAGATPPAPSAVIACTGLAVWDTGKNSSQISDGTYPWRKASVSSSGALATVSSISSPTAALAGIYAYVNAYGTLRISAESTSLFNENYDQGIDANKWISSKVSGGGSIGFSASTGSINSGTVANAYAVLTSVPTFTNLGSTFLVYGTVISLSGSSTGSYRCWGIGNSATTPTQPAALAGTSTAVIDFIGFEYDTSGNLYAVIYSNTTNVYRSAALTSPGTGTTRYGFQMRADIVIFYYGTTEYPAASANFISPSNTLLPILHLTVNGGSAVGVAPQILAAATGIGDSGKNSIQIADGAYQWRKTSVAAASTAPQITDNALVVSQGPNRTEFIGTTTALGSLNAAAIVNASGYVGVGFFLAAGTLTGTLTPEVSYDGGNNWVAGQFDNPITGAKSSTLAVTSPNAVTSMSLIGVAGASYYRVRVSAYTSGTANGSMRANDIIDPTLLATAPPGTAAPVVALQIGGTDGTNIQAVRIKAASTAAAVTDPALVVTQSPNRSENVGTTVALGALNAVATVNAAGFASVGMFLAAGTLIGTIIPETSYDGGTTWVSTLFDNPITGGKVSSFVFASSNTVTSASIIGNGGASQYRVRVSAFTSGTANCTVRANDIRDPSLLATAPPGTTAPTVAIQVGGTDGTNIRVLKIDTLGNAQIKQVAGTGTSTSVTSSAANVNLLALNAARLGASIFNESTSILYVKLGTTSSITSYSVQIAASGYYEIPFGYTGNIDGIWSSANGFARITELT